jgi:hypothetical protein
VRDALDAQDRPTPEQSAAVVSVHNALFPSAPPKDLLGQLPTVTLPPLSADLDLARN